MMTCPYCAQPLNHYSWEFLPDSWHCENAKCPSSFSLSEGAWTAWIGRFYVETTTSGSVVSIRKTRKVKGRKPSNEVVVFFELKEPLPFNVTEARIEFLKNFS